MNFEFNSEESSKEYANKWVSLHSAPVDGERDAEKLKNIDLIEGITPRQQEYLASFNNAATHIGDQFSRKEENLHKSLKEVEHQFNFVKPAYERLRKKVGGRDYEIFIKPLTLLIICIASLASLAILNTFFLDKFMNDGILLKIPGGILFAVIATAIGYFAGYLVRQHGIKHILVYAVGIAFLLFCSVLLMILHSYNYEPKPCILTIGNIIIILLIAVSTYLAYDKEPNYPKTQKKYETLGKKIEQIINDRQKNLRICLDAQKQLKTAAEELDQTYMKNCNADGKFVLNPIKFEIKPLELNEKQ